jgi:Zn finger protein HypA/HybF involved in hydrogenase expression
MKSIIVQGGKFFAATKSGEKIEFVPNQIHCEKCKRRLSVKEYQKNQGQFECPDCGNSFFLQFKAPKKF